MADIPSATVATAYDTPDGDTIILAFNQALYFRAKLEHSLFPPAQLQDYGIHVEATLPQFDPASKHGITAVTDEGEDDTTFIPFSLHSCISYIPHHLPTDEDLQNCNWIYLTSE